MRQARITVLREQAKHLACRIMETSATSFCVATQEPLVPGETVRLWSSDRRGDRRAIAEVTDCSVDDGHYSISLERMDDRLGLLRCVALGELFDSVPADPLQTQRRITATTFTLAAATVALVAGVLLTVFSGLANRASAGEPTFVQAPARPPLPDVPEPPPLKPVNVGPLSIHATSLNWVTACADGKKLFERLFQAGETIEIPFKEAALVRAGNAGGMEVTLRGQSLGVMGRLGAVRMLRATPQGYEYVRPMLTATCGVQ